MVERLEYYNYNVTGQVTNNIRLKFAGSKATTRMATWSTTGFRPIVRTCSS